MSSGPLGLDRLLAFAAESRGRVPVVAFVGAGGKTSSMFALARALADVPCLRPRRVLVTTTTRILNPERASEREGRGFGALLLEADCRSPAALARLAAAPPRAVLAAALSGDGAKLAGITSDALGDIAALFDAILLEADGARGLSIKAPAESEPVLPASATAVVGLIGLDCLGAPLDDRIAHRPELLAELAGCAPGEALAPERLVALALSPRGLFKGVPAGAWRMILLNKADLVEARVAERCAALLRESGAADEVAIAAIGAPVRAAPPAAVVRGAAR